MSERVLNVQLLKKGNPNRTVFILGSTGSGKTTLVANLLQSESRFIIFDTRNEYAADFFEPIAKEVNELNKFISMLNDNEQRIIFKVERDEQFFGALEYLYEFQKANYQLDELPPVPISIDELNRFSSTHDSPNIFREIIQRGRDYKIDKLLGAQWFNTIPTWARDSFSEIYTFRHNDPRGLALLELYGFDKEQVRDLPQYTCLHANGKGIESIKLVAK